MFDIASTELLIVALVALVVIGPKDLPGVMRTVGNWVGRARGMARHFRSGLDTMMREAELEEMEKKWKQENERIMREHPMLPTEGPMEPPEAVGERDAQSSADPASDDPQRVMLPLDAPTEPGQASDERRELP